MKILPDTTKISSTQREIVFKFFSLQCFYFPSGAPFLGWGGVGISFDVLHAVQHTRPNGSWHIGASKQRNSSPKWLWHISLGFCTPWPLQSEGTWALPVGRLTSNKSHPSKAIFTYFKYVAAFLSGRGSTASPLPSFPSPGWALGSFNGWGLPFNLRISPEKSKLFAAWVEPASSYSPGNILSFVLPCNVI